MSPGNALHSDGPRVDVLESLWRLIDPTWEPEGEMRSQIEGLSEGDQVCWYGNTDGSVEARVTAHLQLPPLKWSNYDQQNT